MNPHLESAFHIGAATAERDFQQKLAEWGDYAIPAAGAFSPLAAGLGGAAAAPEGNRLNEGAASFLGSLGGSLGGGAAGTLGGAGVGAGVGAGGAALYNLFQKEPGLLDSLLGEESGKVDVGDYAAGGAGIGALLGGVGGAAGGGAYATHKMRDEAKGDREGKAQMALLKAMHNAQQYGG